MAMEEEVPGLLKLGIGTVLVLAIGFIAVMWANSRHGGYGWLLAHLLLVAWSVAGVFEVLETRGDPQASSIRNSLKLAWVGVIWAAGMVCLLIGALLLKPAGRGRT